MVFCLYGSILISAEFCAPQIKHLLQYMCMSSFPLTNYILTIRQMKVLGPRTKGGNFTIIVHEEWKWLSYHPESIWQIDLPVLTLGIIHDAALRWHVTIKNSIMDRVLWMYIHSNKIYHYSPLYLLIIRWMEVHSGGARSFFEVMGWHLKGSGLNGRGWSAVHFSNAKHYVDGCHCKFEISESIS